MERRVDDAGRDSIRDGEAERRGPGAALDLDPGIRLEPAQLGVGGMHLKPVFAMPAHVLGTPRLSADIVLARSP